MVGPDARASHRLCLRRSSIQSHSKYIEIFGIDRLYHVCGFLQSPDVAARSDSAAKETQPKGSSPGEPATATDQVALLYGVS